MNMRFRFSFCLPLILLLVAALSGCGKPAARCTSPEDNAVHHYLRGMELLENSKLDDAYAKFDRAVYCEDGYGPAYGGLAIVSAYRALSGADAEGRKADTDKAYDQLKRSSKNADTPEDEYAWRVASIRVNTVIKPKNWIEEAESDYKRAMKLKVDENKLVYYDGKEAAGYFMGMAYLEAREFQPSRDSFALVLNAKREGKWHEKADKGWKKTDKIVRALAGITVGGVGKEIALKDSVARGDMAALLVDELKIDKLFAGRIPVRSQIEKLKPEYVPADAEKSQFKDEILTLMKWKVRGLEPMADAATKTSLFKPLEAISRKELALVLEDVIIKLTGDEKMASAFFGHERSPFPDVQPTSAWYNAIMNMTTRSLMETELSGEFRPDDKVDGAEALLAIRVLKQKLNIY